MVLKSTLDGLKSTSRLNPKFYTPSCVKCWALLAIENIPNDIDKLLNKIKSGVLDMDELFPPLDVTVEEDENVGEAVVDEISAVLDPSLSPTSLSSIPSLPMPASLTNEEDGISKATVSLPSSSLPTSSLPSSSLPKSKELSSSSVSPVIPPRTTSASPSILPKRLSSLSDKGDESFDRYTLFTKLVETCMQVSKRDFPLCSVCAAEEIKVLEDNVISLQEQLNSYKIMNNTLDAEENHKIDVLKETKVFQDAENKIISEINAVDVEFSVVNEKISILKEKYDANLAIQKKYMEDRNLCEYQINDLREYIKSTATSCSRMNSLLNQLKKTNVLNDAFYIWYDGPFGTINNFRLGRLPTVNVEWSEINAAWGQAVLLLSTIANQMNYTFESGELISLGSYSKIRIGKSTTIHQLYHEGSYFGRSSFNIAMVTFLACLQEIGVYSLASDRALRLPYEIDKDKIGGLSIKIGRDDIWTKSLKFMLTNLKWLLAWCMKTYSL